MDSPVTIAGSGNLAWHLAPALDNAGYTIREVYSPTRAHAAALVKRLYNAEIKSTLDFSTSRSKIFILAVADEAIEEIAREIILPEDAILVHTSGSEPLSRLGYAATPHIGVFSPLQIFSKAKRIDFRDVPILVESEDAEVGRALVKMGKAISNRVQPVSSHQRMALHVASVFAAGFSNHMFTISSSVLKQNQLNFDLLKPLLAESLNISLGSDLEKALMGPAQQGNFRLLDQHMEFLQNNPEYARMYRIISQHIIDETQGE